jgi:ribosome-associated toxin RatA of RatAB toxin-antitoxin module
MPSVNSSLWINAALPTVYEVAQDIERFPDLMEDLEALQVLSREGGAAVSLWSARISAFRMKVRWKQEDVWDDEARTCRFRQIEGDFDFMRGEWRFVQDSGGTRFHSSLEYEFRVPGLGSLAGSVIQGLIKKNLEAAMAAIGRAAEER